MFLGLVEHVGQKGYCYQKIKIFVKKVCQQGEMYDVKQEVIYVFKPGVNIWGSGDLTLLPQSHYI